MDGIEGEVLELTLHSIHVLPVHRSEPHLYTHFAGLWPWRGPRGKLQHRRRLTECEHLKVSAKLPLHQKRLTEKLDGQDRPSLLPPSSMSPTHFHQHLDETRRGQQGKAARAARQRDKAGEASEADKAGQDQACRRSQEKVVRVGRHDKPPECRLLALPVRNLQVLLRDLHELSC